ncbi:RxLR effector protein [Phytophthora megakarya]|uniref:RxLR effector protein n=1 Tax=Phytophthora megakarya TaxID=4795 RepID=A0A225V8V4_9STRA|nr:RxLR effector protein [Phytophthora megakarya]
MRNLAWVVFAVVVSMSSNVASTDIKPSAVSSADLSLLKVPNDNIQVKRPLRVPVDNGDNTNIDTSFNMNKEERVATTGVVSRIEESMRLTSRNAKAQIWKTVDKVATKMKEAFFKVMFKSGETPDIFAVRVANWGGGPTLAKFEESYTAWYKTVNPNWRPR